MQISNENNPMGTDGFEFLEFSSPDPQYLEKTFRQFGFIPIAKHKSKQITLYRQNRINFILNAEKDTQAEEHAQQHGSGACAMGFRVQNAKQALQHAIDQGAQPFHSVVHAGELEIPAILGIGGSVIYFIDTYKDEEIYHTDFELISDAPTGLTGAGLSYIDHLTHNVNQGHMDHWADFYKRIFNFRQIRYFEIKGKMTGLVSRALASPCGKIKIPLNEATDPKSQIEEFLEEYHGEGIQHIALSTDKIYQTIETLRKNNVQFLTTPDTYYEKIDKRLPWHHEDIALLRKGKILIDGGVDQSEGLLLQIFTENLFGPAFFEIIQRKGNQGFGEGNFTALFEAIEEDQIRRGILKEQ